MLISSLHPCCADLTDVYVSLLDSCTQPERWALFCVNKYLHQVTRPHLPLRMYVRVSHEGISRSCASAQRSHTDLPILTETFRVPTYLRADAFSQLTVDFSGKSIWPAPCLGLEDEVWSTALHNLEGFRPLRTVHLLCNNHCKTPLGGILQNIHQGIRGSVTTLELRYGYQHWSQGSGYSFLLLSMQEDVVFEHLTTLTLSVGTDLNCIQQGMLQQLQTLELSCCIITGWEVLPQLSNLKTLRISRCIGEDNIVDVISRVTWLKELRVKGMYFTSEALHDYTRLEVLGLWYPLCSPPRTGSLQADLALLGAGCPLLRVLDVCVPVEFVVPDTWQVGLESFSIHYKYHSWCPAIPNVTELKLSWENPGYMPDGFFDSFNMPPRLRKLSGPGDALLAALGCHELREITVTPFSLFFMMNNQERLLLAVGDASVWSQLDRLLILFEGRNHWARMYMRQLQSYHVQLLRAVASRRACVITHITLEQSSAAALEAAIMVTSVRSMTLMNMSVGITALQRALRMPRLELLELMGISGITKHERRGLRAVARLRGVQVVEARG